MDVNQLRNSDDWHFSKLPWTRSKDEELFLSHQGAVEDYLLLGWKLKRI